MCDALQLNWKLNPNVSGNNNATMEVSGTVGTTKTPKSSAKSASGHQGGNSIDILETYLRGGLAGYRERFFGKYSKGIEPCYGSRHISQLAGS